MHTALPLMLALVAQAEPNANQITGQVVAVGAQGRLTLNLTADHVRGGERAQIVRQTTAGGWVRAAVGDVTEVTPAGSVLVVTRYEPNMQAAVMGDYVIVSLTTAQAVGAGYPGQAPGTGVPAAPDEPGAQVEGAANPAKEVGDELAVAIGLKYFAAFAGKQEPDQAPPGESAKAGFGWAIGPALELRAWKYLALETGVSFYENTLSKKTSLGLSDGGTCLVEQDVKSTAVRVPLIVKGVVPIKIDEELGMRLSLGTGIEWLFGRDSELALNTGGCQLGGVATDPVRAVDQRFFVLHIGVGLTVQDVIVSLDIRGAYNGDNTPKFNDYLNGETEPMEHTVDAGLLLGVSYEHDAL